MQSDWLPALALTLSPVERGTTGSFKPKPFSQFNCPPSAERRPRILPSPPTGTMQSDWLPALA